MKPMLPAMFLTCVTAALADDVPEPLPDFATCMDLEVARFERAMERLWQVPGTEPFEVGGTTGVGYCGGVGITLCDRLGDVVPCLAVLEAEQEALRAKVLGALPAPEALDGHDDPLARDLYRPLHALAQGTSAGPDCGGTEGGFGAWCKAWAANDALRMAVRTWELARYLGAVQDAVSAGWAHPPPPTRPRARKDAE